MDNIKVGELIRKLRYEKHMTQKQLAEILNISDKTVSKWERGMGYPDVLLISKLSQILDVDMQVLLSGELHGNELLSGNMKNMIFYVCPYCGNLITSMVETKITCCGRKLKSISPIKAEMEDKLLVERIENDYYISSTHEMNKDHYITFVALISSDTIMFKKLYPEWDLQLRIPIFAHGKLVWYCSRHGLYYQYI